MKNISVGDNKPIEDDEEVQIIDEPSSSNVPQVDGDELRLQMKIHMSLMIKRWNKLKMLMHHNLPIKWLKEETRLYYKHIHKISS